MTRESRRSFHGLVCWQVKDVVYGLEFYGNAVLLRYEYPMMIVTRTKDIFMKRLKRNKKMLTEEGSSDESKTNTLSRSIQLHTNTFLDSVDSSQLSKKTNQLRDELFPEFIQKVQHDQSYDSQIHDINNPVEILQDVQNMGNKEIVQNEDAIMDKLSKLMHNLGSTTTEIVDSQTLKINLSPKEEELNSLICDFDEIDKQKITNQYKKLQKKQQKSLYSKSPEDQSHRFRKKQQMYISPLNFNDHDFNHEKTLQSPKNRKQIQQNGMEIQLKKRNSFETQNFNHKIPIYPIKNSLSNNASERRFDKLEESYKTLQRFKPETYRKHNENENRHVYENYDYRSRQKVNSYRQNFLPKQHRITNNFQLNRYQHNDFNDYELQIERKRKTQYYDQKSPYQSPQRYQTNPIQQAYIQEFKAEDQNRIKYQSPKFKDLKEYEHRSPQHQQFQLENIRKQNLQEKMTKNQYLGRTDHKNAPQPIIDDTPSVSYHQSDLDQKLQKKRKIREKAAQLLSRVRSHQYLTTRLHVPYHHRY